MLTSDRTSPKCFTSTLGDIGIDAVIGRPQHATARIFRFGTKGARIRVSDQIVHAGWRRFSIAHVVNHVER